MKNIQNFLAITTEVINDSISYTEYLQLIDKLLAEGKTTGNNHSDAMIDYTRLNRQRMQRVAKSVTLTQETIQSVKQIEQAQTWLVLVEAWCGDVAINLPVIAMMAAQNPNINLRLILRDEHTGIMDQYLTNGARSIPKLICINAETLEVLGSWGPRPAQAQEMVMAHKANPAEPYSEFVKKLMLWYAQDKGQSIQKEFCTIVQK